jgi:hypothetical protein
VHFTFQILPIKFYQISKQEMKIKLKFIFKQINFIVKKKQPGKAKIDVPKKAKILHHVFTQLITLACEGHIAYIVFTIKQCVLKCGTFSHNLVAV